jgi:hypothetical protein
MTLTEARSGSVPFSARPSAARLGLAAATLVSFLLVLQNFALDILPDRTIHISPSQIRPYSGEKTFAYVVDFDGSEPDNWPSLRSRVRFLENGHPFRKLRQRDEVILVGGDRFTHEPGRIVFSSMDNSDPRTDGWSFDIVTPVLYLPAIGDAAMAVFLACVVAWHFLCRGDVPPARLPRTAGLAWRWHLVGATALFFIGLYCNSGALTPYAVTSAPLVDPTTGYAYNGDQPHFRVLFDFVDGRSRSVWDHAILLRRILFPALGWPLMKALGFNLGGVLTSFIVNVASFVAALVLLRRWVGERGAVVSGWLMALYPGAAYWAGLPYTYALIFPASLLLMLGLMRISVGRDMLGLAAVSLAMGVAYLGYDLAMIFIPATVIMLAWQRRPLVAVGSVIIQAAPIAIWVGMLTWVFHQPLQNDNSGVYVSVFSVYLHPLGFAWWWREFLHVPSNGLEIFFASNFIFLPALFLLVLALNPLTSRINFRVAEVALLVSGVALFLFLNLAPSKTGGWQMRGTWIARIYQPLFPALVLYIARWWQDLPPLTRPWRVLVTAAVAASLIGNALILFGPILGNPGGLSETAFYRFYNHTDAHFLYEENLDHLGRRPLGFKRDMSTLVSSPSPQEMRAQLKARMDEGLRQLAGIRSATIGNTAMLKQVQRAFRDVGRALAEARSDVFARELALRVAKSEITAIEAQRQAKNSDYFVWPALRAVLDDATLDSEPKAPATDTVPANLVDLNAALIAESKVLTDRQRELTQAQDALTKAEGDLARAQDEQRRLETAAVALTHH